MEILKKYYADVLAVCLFVAIAFAYFYPATMDGRRLQQHDHNANDGISVELNEYRNAHEGETPRWVRSVFSGMPTYQIAPSYGTGSTLQAVTNAYHLWLPEYVWYVFVSLLGFYIMLRAFDFKVWMAALGAIVWAFSSYFFIIIAAGHIWKVMTLAYIPPTIGGLLKIYGARKHVKMTEDGKTSKQYVYGLVAGFLLTAVFGAMQISANHVQMTYYFLVPCGLIALAYLVSAVREKSVMDWLKKTGVVALAAVLAVCMNLSNLYHTYEYSKHTMRGKSELVKQNKVEDQTDSGLERSYITAWSYGKAETWTLLVPNANGGASMPLQMNEVAMSKANPQLTQGGIYGAFTQYWGEQPGTSGPVYVGALVCLLFVLGMIIIPNREPLKWAMVIATILSIMLAWGKNFMGLTDFFIDYVPMYSKFRTVASILVVAEFTIPFVAMWALKLFVESAEEEKVRMRKALLISVGITAGICLLMAVMPEAFFGECLSTSDRRAIDQYVGAGYFDASFGQQILLSIASMREAMLTSDAWRSFYIIIIGAALMGGLKLFSVSPKNGERVLVPALILLCLWDMWGVNKRYLNDAMFVTPTPQAATQQKTEADEFILQTSGSGRNYRVLNLTVSTFNDNTTSALFNSIGGYHAAKLRRYQELVEACIQPEISNLYKALSMAKMDTVAMMQQASPYPMYDFTTVPADSLFPVLNMLNMKWAIVGGGQDGKVKIPIENNTANGNAWFVKEVKKAANANEELDLLHQVSPKEVAVALGEDADKLSSGALGEGRIDLVTYEANSASYTAESKDGGVAVFSEVFYPGWTATVDGEPAEVVRVNYVLRAVRIPSGKHTIVMTYEPDSIKTTETIGYASMGVLLLLAMLTLFMAFYKK